MKISRYRHLKSGGAITIAIAISACFKIKAVCSVIIDTKSPIVIHDIGDGSPTDGSSNQYSNSKLNDNYFGYSLAFMEGYFGEGQLKPSISFKTGTGDGRGTLFIGAPNEKRVTKNSGVVWECKFNGGNTDLSCSILSQISSKKPLPPDSRCSGKKLVYSENETEQWIGGSLSVSLSRSRDSPAKLFACAPRWKINGWINPHYSSANGCEESGLMGACYVSSSPTSNVEVLDPLNKPGEFHYQDGKENSLQYWLLYGEFGFSSHVTWTDKLLVGAPNVRNWRGAIAEYRRGTGPGNSPILHNKNGEASGVEPHSYLGYTVTSGQTGGQGYFIASGAPRAANLYGVVTLSFSSSTAKPVAFYKGEQLGSYFGYALATVDLSGDGYDELIVGAPWYTDFKTSTAYNTGCVYIFDVSRLPNPQPLEPKLCMGFQSSSVKVSMGSRFGSAISNLGDINGDNYEDFAISAPYDDDGVGTIFIYHGGYPIQTKPVQVIRGKSLGVQNLHGFGTYLLGGNRVDIDGNGTPDLVMASFESRHVVALRTRPVAKASVKVDFYDDAADIEIYKLLPNQHTFRVRICVAFQFLKIELPSENRLNAWLNFDMDPRDKRVDFDDPSEQTEQNHPLFSTKETCLVKRFKLKDVSSEGTSENPIIFRASVKYNETEILEAQPVEQAIIMLSSTRPVSQDKRQYQQAYHRFDPYLPAPIPPTWSSVQRLEIAKDNCDSDGNPDCNPDLKLYSRILYRLIDESNEKEWSKDETLVIGQLESLVVSIVVSNGKETAYRPTVNINFGVSTNFDTNYNQLRFSWRKTPDPKCDPTPQSSGRKTLEIVHGLRCSKLHGGRKMSYELEIRNLKHLKLKEPQKEGYFKLRIEAYPELRELDKKVSQDISLPSKADVNIDVESRTPTTGQSAIDPKMTTLVDLTQLYIIKNSGWSATARNTLKATILVPTHVNFNKKGNWTRVLGVANPSTLNIQCEAINFQFFSVYELGRAEKNMSGTEQVGKTVRSRTARSESSTFPPLRVIPPEKVTVSESKDHFITLSGCDGNTDNMLRGLCQTIQCTFDLPSKGSREIKIHMYLLKNEFAKLLSEDTKGVRVDSHISVFYIDEKVTEITGSTQRELLLTKGVPAWIYLASGAGGTILLLLVTFGLFKCGFFRRKRKEQLQQLKRQTMHLQQMDVDALNAALQEHEDND